MGISNQTVTIVDNSGATTVVTAGSAVSTSGTMVMGSDGTNGQFIKTDTTGRIITADVGTTGTTAPTQANLIGASDGTNLVALRIKAASTAAVATDPSLVVALSPNTPAKIWDGTNTVAVKAASTAAVATDPSLVVALSPNSSSVMFSDRQVSGSLGALNANLVINTQGANTLIIDIAGTWVGTILVDASFDGGATYPGTITAFSSNTFYPGGAGLTANGIYYVPVAGVTNVKLLMTAYTSGTATVEMNAAAGSEYTKLLSYISDGSNVAAVKASSTSPVATDPALVVALSPNSIGLFGGGLTATSYPDQGNYSTGGSSSVTIDGFGNLQTRGTVLTDEGSFRDDFTGSGLTTALTGTVNFTASSTAVTGTGTTFTTQVRTGQYIKKTADAETLYVQVASVNSDTSLTLVSAYGGTTAGAASVVSNWQTTTGTGGSFAVASSILSIASGTTANAVTNLKSLGDYPPYSVQFYGTISQRIANQTAYFGLQDVVGLTPNQQATVQASGTTNTQVNFVTSFANTAADTQTTVATIPNGGTTATSHLYKIDLSSNQATLSIDGVVVATNTIHLPSPYTTMYLCAGFTNAGTAPASSTTLALDYVFFENVDRIQVDSDFNGEPLYVGGNTLVGPSQAVPTVASESLRATYFISLQGFATGTTNTDIFNLIGSATKIVRLHRVRFSMTVTTAVTIPVQLIKRSTANTFGTGGVAVNGSMDSNDPAATATNFASTANATALGTVVGTAIRSDKYFAQVATPTTPAEVLEWNFGGVDKPPTLRGVAQSLCINFGGVTIAGGNVSITFEWSEDTN